MIICDFEMLFQSLQAFTLIYNKWLMRRKHCPRVAIKLIYASFIFSLYHKYIEYLLHKLFKS